MNNMNEKSVDVLMVLGILISRNCRKLENKFIILCLHLDCLDLHYREIIKLLNFFEMNLFHCDCNIYWYIFNHWRKLFLRIF